MFQFTFGFLPVVNVSAASLILPRLSVLFLPLANLLFLLANLLVELGSALIIPIADLLNPFACGLVGFIPNVGDDGLRSVNDRLLCFLEGLLDLLRRDIGWVVLVILLEELWEMGREAGSEIRKSGPALRIETAVLRGRGGETRVVGGGATRSLL